MYRIEWAGDVRINGYSGELETESRLLLKSASSGDVIHGEALIRPIDIKEIPDYFEKQRLNTSEEIQEFKERIPSRDVPLLSILVIRTDVRQSDPADPSLKDVQL